MKKLFLILLLFLLLFSIKDACGQWRGNSYDYVLKIYKINEGYEIPFHFYKSNNDTITYKAVYDTLNPPYVSPYTSFLLKSDTTLGNPSLWNEDTLILKKIVNFPVGSYELILHEIAMDSNYVWVEGEATNALYLKVDSSEVTPIGILSLFEASIFNGAVLVEWKINGSEATNINGFNLYRKEVQGNEIKLNNSLILKNVEQVLFDFSDYDVVAGNIYTYILESISYSGISNIEGSVSITIPIIYDIYLAQNYPNPFNPGTTIEFTIRDRSKVSLLIYDINGKLVDTIIDGEIMDYGEYKKTIFGDNLSSGTYIYVLKAHNIITRQIQILSRKMILLK